MTAALEGGEWSAARPGRILPPGKTRYPLYRKLGGPQGRCGRAEILVPTGIQSRTVLPVVGRYTEWATGPTKVVLDCNIIYIYSIDYWKHNGVPHLKINELLISINIFLLFRITSFNLIVFIWRISYVDSELWNL